MSVSRPAELEWRLVGRVDLVRRLRFLLEGYEEETYWSSQSSETDGVSRLRTRQKLVLTTELAAVAGTETGVVTVSVPPEFNRRDKARAFKLRVRGDVRRRLNIDDRFTVAVSFPR